VTARASTPLLLLALLLARAAPAPAAPDPSTGPLMPAGQAPAAGGLGRSIAVLGFDALGMDASKVARLEALFRIELERLSGAPAPSPREIARALGSSPLARCGGETACLAAIGKKLGVALVVSGNVAELGDSYVINIKVVDAQSARELRRIASDPLRGNPDELIEAVRVAAYRLLAPERLLGSISILADISGAEVRLDGRPVGHTPLVRPLGRLPLGQHRLEVKEEGYSPFAQTVQVRFQKTTRVEVRLLADPTRPRLDLGASRAAAAGEGPRWYGSTWFLIGAGVAAVVVGGLIGRAVAHDDVVDCSASPEACR
jgi:hypothetical protein